MHTCVPDVLHRDRRVCICARARLDAPTKSSDGFLGAQMFEGQRHLHGYVFDFDGGGIPVSFLYRFHFGHGDYRGELKIPGSICICGAAVRRLIFGVPSPTSILLGIHFFFANRHCSGIHARS